MGMRHTQAAVASALLGLAACSTAEAPTAPATPPAAAPVAASDLLEIVYSTHPRPLRLDLYLPAGTPPFGVVLWVHGGGWQSGTKALGANHHALRERSRGYAVASIEYRLSGEAVFPAQIQDVKAAVRYLRANAARHNLDATRFAAWGSSAGGHLVALLGTSAGVAAFDDAAQGNAAATSAVQAVVDWYGPTDFLLQSAAHHAADSPESRLLGCDIDVCLDRVQAANPLTHVDPGDPPFLIEHGSSDATVDPIAGEALHAVLLAAGVPSTHVVLAGAGHGGPEFTSPENLARVDAFLDQRLRQQR
jgi:acetyl esterase/lipase